MCSIYNFILIDALLPNTTQVVSRTLEKRYHKNAGVNCPAHGGAGNPPQFSFEILKFVSISGLDFDDFLVGMVLFGVGFGH